MTLDIGGWTDLGPLFHHEGHSHLWTDCKQKPWCTSKKNATLLILHQHCSHVQRTPTSRISIANILEFQPWHQKIVFREDIEKLITMSARSAFLYKSQPTNRANENKRESQPDPSPTQTQSHSRPNLQPESNIWDNISWTHCRRNFLIRKEETCEKYWCCGFSKRKPMCEEPITFGKKDMHGVEFPHLDVVVISINIWRSQNVEDVDR